MFFFTDPTRVPDPLSVLDRLPEGSGVILRHFGKPGNRLNAKALCDKVHRRGLQCLIANDPTLARDIGADGVHWPERHLARARAWAQSHPHWLHTGAAHSLKALQRAHYARLDGVFLSPVFASQSPSATHILSETDRQTWLRQAHLHVLALGGVTPARAQALKAEGFYGWGAIEAWLNDDRNNER
ncbi:thiamine phosphate synthase [Woodsholea maritima]|uniref:thiamine phosphate synthase n=1 Tax=Woodsholea maritima TaxID=240237 RepID=UPI00035EA773|nr:thiamine phosphate synthase [Woodsholea maritima]